MRTRAIITVLIASGAVATASIGFALAQPSADEPASEVLSPAELLSVDPIDVSEAATVGWSQTLSTIQGRAVGWYQEHNVSELDDGTLADAIMALSAEIGDPSVTSEPEQLMYVQELVYRREAACRSLSPTSELRADYCSETSVPGFDEIPWDQGP